MAQIKEYLKRPAHIKDDGHAHVKFDEKVDPNPYLKKYGYCVVENVMTKEFCEKIVNDMWSWLENLGTGIKKDNPASWNNDNWPYNLRNGMLQHTLGQEEFMWLVREHPNILKLFEKIFDNKNLLVSLDGASINRPISSGYTTSSDESWIHTDQDIAPVTTDQIYNSEYYSVQGIANFIDASDDDGSLFVAESSHLLHTELFKKNGKQPKKNWYILKKDDLDFLIQNKIKFVKLNAPQGSFILFDSRCFHSGYPSYGEFNTTWRFVIYISLSPASRAKDSDLEIKKRAIKEGLTTNHWSSSNSKLFELPSTEHQKSYMTRKENNPDVSKWSISRKKLAGLIK